MYHGEATNTAGARVGVANFPPALGEREGNLAKGEALAPSISNIFESASITRKMAFDRLDAVEQFAARATAIATKMAGAYPSSGPAQGQDPETADKAEPRSAVEAALRETTNIRTPLFRMEKAFRELHSALDVIDRAIG